MSVFDVTHNWVEIIILLSEDIAFHPPQSPPVEMQAYACLTSQYFVYLTALMSLQLFTLDGP